MVQVVNGYPCFSCADVDKAKHNQNPKAAQDAAGNPKSAQDAAGSAATAAAGKPSGPPGQPGAPGTDPAAQAGAVTAATGVNAPLTEGHRGTLYNLVA
jgi:hypothetical protein